MAGLDVRPLDSQESPRSVVNAVKKMIPTLVHSNMQVGPIMAWALTETWTSDS